MKLLFVYFLIYGRSVRKISKLGHKSSKTTEIYTHVSKNGLDKIKNPIDNFLNSV